MAENNPIVSGKVVVDGIAQIRTYIKKDGTWMLILGNNNYAPLTPGQDISAAKLEAQYKKNLEATTSTTQPVQPEEQSPVVEQPVVQTPQGAEVGSEFQVKYPGGSAASIKKLDDGKWWFVYPDGVGNNVVDESQQSKFEELYSTSNDGTKTVNYNSVQATETPVSTTQPSTTYDPSNAKFGTIDYSNLDPTKFGLFDPKAINFDFGTSYYSKDKFSEDVPQFWNSAANSKFNYWANYKWNIGDPCGDGQMAKIHRSLHKFFITIKGIKKYGDFYLNGAINKVQNLQSTIKATTAAIASVLRTVIQRLRNWLLNYVKELITYAIEELLPNWVRQIKKSFVAQILDQIFCGIKKIIKGLVDLVGDFLYSLIGQIINTPFCVAERFASALISRLVNDIDTTLAPIFDSINELLSGVAKVWGSVSKAINVILGFQGFLCGEPNCPDIKEFKLQGWGGPSPTEMDNFNNFNFINPNFPGEITNQVDGWMNDFFGPESKTSQSPGDCYSGTFECGIPQIVLFGGGGTGAVAQAVVNKVGQVIGSNILSGGSGYTSPPFVSIEDPAECGSGAAAYSVLDDNGSVVKLTFINPGNDYNTTFNGGAPVINTFVGTPNPAFVGGTVKLNWEVTNADVVSLNIPGYDVLPSIGSASFPIPIDTPFSPGESTTTIKYILTAKKTNKDSQSQVETKELKITVKKTDVTGEKPVNTDSPVIDSFTVSPGTVKPGEIYTLKWNTSNVTNVALGDPGYASLPEDSSVSLVAPLKLDFPADGSNAVITHTLTATNSNATNNKTTSNTIQVFVSPVDVSAGTGNGTGTDEGAGTGAGSTGGSDGTGNSNGVAVIDDIDIINTGIGYTSTDTSNISDGSGANITFDINPSGQIVGVNVLNSGYGFTTIPDLSINSLTGLGAEFRVNLKFIPLNEFLQDQNLLESQIDPDKLVQVVDCVSR